jgi:hypothetical protein
MGHVRLAGSRVANHSSLPLHLRQKKFFSKACIYILKVSELPFENSYVILDDGDIS